VLNKISLYKYNLVKNKTNKYKLKTAVKANKKFDYKLKVKGRLIYGEYNLCILPRHIKVNRQF